MMNLAEVHDIDALSAHLVNHQTVKLRKRARGCSQAFEEGGEIGEVEHA